MAAVSDVLDAHQSSLESIFYSYADTEGTQIGLEKQRKLLSHPEFQSMCRGLDLFDHKFTARDATLIFVKISPPPGLTPFSQP